MTLERRGLVFRADVCSELLCGLIMTCDVRGFIVVLGVILFAIVGCEVGIGDKCTTSNDCPMGLICDTDSKGGYCLTYNCQTDEECPEGGTCVRFTQSTTFCMKRCRRHQDCPRSGHVCREDLGENRFCYDESDGIYGRNPDNEVPFEISGDDEESPDGGEGPDDGEEIPGDGEETPDDGE